MTRVVEQEDMSSWGVLGLLDAIEAFDLDRPGRKVKFESYVISKVRWAILDEIRSQDWVPRRVRLRAEEVEQAILRLSQERSRPPTEYEIAEEVGMKLSGYRGFLDQYSRAQVASLNARLEREGGSGVEYGAFREDPAALNPESETNVEEVRGHLASAISELDEQERVVAAFYFYEGLTLKEIGKALNLTEGRISQTLRNALTKLRKRLKDSTLAFGNWQETFS